MGWALFVACVVVVLTAVLSPSLLSAGAAVLLVLFVIAVGVGAVARDLEVRRIERGPHPPGPEARRAQRPAAGLKLRPLRTKSSQAGSSPYGGTAKSTRTPISWRARCSSPGRGPRNHFGLRSTSRIPT